MKYKKTKNRLTARLTGDFNLDAVREIKNILDDRNELYIDLERAHFVDSEAIIFLHNLIQNQKKVRLKNPPRVFFDALRILGLHKTWDLKTIVER